MFCLCVRTRGYRQAIEMCYYLLRNEGIWVGPSAALNVVGTGLIQSGTGLPFLGA